MQGATAMHGIEPIQSEVSIHAPYAGSDISCTDPAGGSWQFQSTPPMQGATNSQCRNWRDYDCFNPRPLCRERRQPDRDCNKDYGVSIHAPYAGSDTCISREELNGSHVSIHAPYAGSDVMPLFRMRLGPLRFNPRPLSRERREARHGVGC